MYIKSIEYLSRLFNVNFLYRKANNPVIMPMYHAVGIPEELDYLKGLYIVKDEYTFEKELDQLLKHFEPIDLFQLINLYECGFPNLGKKQMFLSFDDGLSCCYHNIAPILERKGVPATFFVCSGLMGNTKMFHRFKSTVIFKELLRDDNFDLNKSDIEKIAEKPLKSQKEIQAYLLSLRYTENHILDKIAKSFGVDFSEFQEIKKPYMDEKQIRLLLKKGFTIGAHSIDHPEYYLLSLNEQIKQTSESVNNITEKFGVDYRIFAFPFTDVGVNKAFFKKISDAHNVLLTFGGSGIKSDIIFSNLHRIPMDVQAISGINMLRSELMHYHAKRSLGRHIFYRN